MALEKSLVNLEDDDDDDDAIIVLLLCFNQGDDVV